MNERANEFEKLPSDTVFAWYEVGMEILIWKKLHFFVNSILMFIYIYILIDSGVLYDVLILKKF